MRVSCRDNERYSAGGVGFDANVPSVDRSCGRCFVKLPSVSSGVQTCKKQMLGKCVFMALAGCGLRKCALLLGSWTARR